MRRVREYIELRRTTFAKHPLFAYLVEPSIDPRRRLSFVPFLAHFVMTFADLYVLVLPDDPPRDRYQELVNIHVREDATHWKWFLADLSNAEMDPIMRFTDVLRFIWSKDTVRTRLLSYEICKLTGAMSSLQKLIMVNCIEAGGGVALGAVAVAGRSLPLAAGRKLIYFGSHHVDTEADHTLEAHTVRRFLEEIVLNDVECTNLCAIVDQVFALLEAFITEVFELARAGHTLVPSVSTTP